MQVPVFVIRQGYITLALAQNINKLQEKKTRGVTMNGTALIHIEAAMK